MLKIEVQNTGKHFENRILQEINENNGIEPLEKDKSGIGLKHTKEILSIMYGQEHLLYLENEEPDIAKVTVWIPKKVIREFGVK